MSEEEVKIPEEATPEPEVAPKPVVKKATKKQAKAKMVKVMLVSPYPLVDPQSKVRFSPNTEMEAKETGWLKAQIKAGLIEEL